MEALRLEPKLDWTIRWNINQIEEKMDSVRINKENLEKIFCKEFNIEHCQINTDGENVTVTLHLSELTQDDIQKLNEIASLYTIEPHNSEVCLRIFQFKGAEE